MASRERACASGPVVEEHLVMPSRILYVELTLLS
jgi:hypothetical protein